jgi:hypothetical protein
VIKLVPIVQYDQYAFYNVRNGLYLNAAHNDDTLSEYTITITWGSFASSNTINSSYVGRLQKVIRYRLSTTASFDPMFFEIDEAIADNIHGLLTTGDIMCMRDIQLVPLRYIGSERYDAVLSLGEALLDG